MYLYYKKSDPNANITYKYFWAGATIKTRVSALFYYGEIPKGTALLGSPFDVNHI